MAVAERNGGRIVCGAPEAVGAPSTLIERLRSRMSGATILLGFDFPIGVPTEFAKRAGIDGFREFLTELASGDLPNFFTPAESPSEISLKRPFYPQRPGNARQAHLVSGLGVPDYQALFRLCDRRDGRRNGCALFWTLGGNQVGRAASHGWQHVLCPLSMNTNLKCAFWPFDGELQQLIASSDVVISETYPAEFYHHLQLGLASRGSKLDVDARRLETGRLRETAASLGVHLADAAVAAVSAGFGVADNADDDFDAFVGLLGMLRVVLGHQPPGPPARIDRELLRVEGWILGQA